MNFALILPPLNAGQLSAQTHDFVIPAKAGIHERILWQQHCLDSLSFPRRRELRGNDDLKRLD